jgi:hypothetical protein
MIKRSIIFTIVVYLKFINASLATDIGPDKAQYLINYQPIDTIFHRPFNQRGDQVYAFVDDTALWIEYPAWDHLLVKTIGNHGDYDKDGNSDAIIFAESGAACCGAELYLVSHRGDRFFTTHKFDTAPGISDVKVTTHENTDHIKIYIDESVLEGDGTQRSVVTFQFQNGVLKKLNSLINRAQLVAIDEISSGEKDPQYRKLYIDSDGEIDYVECTKSKPNGFLDCKVNLSQYGDFFFPKNCKRILVLPTSSLGVQNLGCNQQLVGKFTGTFFEWEN